MTDSFLEIDNICEANKDTLLEMRRTLFASVVWSFQRQEYQKRYLAALVVFTEFERLTRHITETGIVKN